MLETLSATDELLLLKMIEEEGKVLNFVDTRSADESRGDCTGCHSGDHHAVWEILLVPTGALRPPVMHIHSPRSPSIDLLTIACRAERLPAALNEALRLTPVGAYGSCLLTCVRPIESYDGCLDISGITTANSHILSPSSTRSFPNNNSIFDVYVRA